MLVVILRELTPVLLCLYVVDCFSIVHGGDLVVASHAGASLSLVRRRLAFTAAFPEGSCFLLPRAPVLLGPSGAFFPKARTEGSSVFVSSSYAFRSYDELGEIAVEGPVVHAAGLSVRCSSPGSGRRLADALSSLARAKPAGRTPAVEALARAARDGKAIRSRRRTLFREARGLRDAGWAFFAAGFVLLPLVTYAKPFEERAWIGALAYGGTYALVLFLAVRSTRRLRSRGIPVPVGAIASFILSPPSAARASVNVVRNGFEDFDSLATASALLSRPRLSPLLAVELHGSRVALKEEAGLDWSAYWKARVSFCESLARGAARRKVALFVADDPRSAGVCVFCRAEYIDASIERCSDCNFDLMRLEPASPSAAG